MSRPTIDHIDLATFRMGEIQNPPPAMWAAYRELVTAHAPDLLDMVWDEDAATGFAQ